jgi:AcrR family transcriptional regulator
MSDPLAYKDSIDQFVSPSVPEDLRYRVLGAALDELAKWGVERFSVEAVAARHNIDQAEVYRYWRDGHQLLLDALRFWSATAVATPDTGSLRGDLEALTAEVVDCFNTELGRRILRGLVMDHACSYGDQTRQIFWRQRFGVIRAMLDRASFRGELRDGIEPLAAMQILVSPLTVRALYTEEPITLEYAMTIAELAFHAMARPVG